MQAAAITGATELVEPHDRSLVAYGLIRMHLIAGVATLVISMTAGFLYSLQFLGYYPFAGSELRPRGTCASSTPTSRPTAGW